MAGDSTAMRREELGERLKGIEGADSKNDLISEIEGALGVHAPMGDPGAMEQAAKQYTEAADAVDEGDPCIRHLPVPEPATQLAHRLDQEEHAEHPGMGPGQAAARGVRRQERR